MEHMKIRRGCHWNIEKEEGVSSELFFSIITLLIKCLYDQLVFFTWLILTSIGFPIGSSLAWTFFSQKYSACLLRFDNEVRAYYKITLECNTKIGH